MKITNRDIDVFNLLARHRYLRRTFIHALLATPLDSGRLRHRIYLLSANKYLHEPDFQQNSKNFRYTPRVYELGAKGRELIGAKEHPPVKAHEGWHQLMINDILASLEVACMHRGLTFELHPCTQLGKIRPDAHFSINGTHFALEADRGTESNAGKWDEKIVRYADLFANRTYQKDWNVQSLIVLCMFASPVKAENVRLHIQDKMKKKSRSLWFMGKKALGSRDHAPDPMTTLPEELWYRAGHDPKTILAALTEVPIGYTKAA